MSDNEPSPEKRIATEQTLLRLGAVSPEDVSEELLVDIHDVFEDHGIPMHSVSVERWRTGYMC
ncbi:hypothetical protein [Haladaptatus sp. DYF46]|uniref:hypothetical protein n=1 Tax=Haladaptatus sp. DYF46 TaxID=2886041 RepID=UPI001E53D091|nr:hypothetical protein [Haladaptatus sp. DYF46]